jgi:hypothetical protein
MASTPDGIYFAADDGSGWLWRDGDWTDLPAPTPGIGALVYDSTSNQLIFTSSDQVYVWTGQAWSSLRTLPFDPGTSAYDPGSDLIMSLGCGNQGCQTWSWSLGATQPKPVGEFPNGGHSLVYFPPLSEMVVIGDVNGSMAIWEQSDQTKWVPRSTINAPVKRTNNALAFDPNMRSIIIYGGCGGLLQALLCSTA